MGSPEQPRVGRASIDRSGPRGFSAPRSRRPPRVGLSRRRALITQHTQLQSLPDLPSIRLHLGSELEAVWGATRAALKDTEAPVPFWAYAWSGGIGLARYLLDTPGEVAGRSVLDMATGSGLCAIAAMQAGASSATGSDIDPFAEVAVASNARANGVRIGFLRRDLLDEAPPAVDVVLAGDTWYDAAFAERLGPWLQAAADGGSRVLVGDPGRRYAPRTGLDPLATYALRTTTLLEDRDIVEATVFWRRARR